MSAELKEGAPCPVCGVGPAKSCNSTLTLRQINFSEAIYVCSNEECCYPVGEEVEPLIVKRDISQLLSEEKKSSLMESTFLQHSTVSGVMHGVDVKHFLVVSFLSLSDPYQYQMTSLKLCPVWMCQ